MAKQTINLGTAGTQSGDTIRNAFDICNDNFSDLYSPYKIPLNGICVKEHFNDTSTTKTIQTSNVLLDSFSFTAPLSGKVIYEIQAIADSYANKFIQVGLASNSGLTTEVVPENRVSYSDETDMNSFSYKVQETGLTGGSTITRYVYANSNSGSTSYIRWGGSYLPLIVRVLTSGY